MAKRMPEPDEVWLRYDGVEVEILIRAQDAGGPYVRVLPAGSNRPVRVGLEQFARGGARAWKFVRNA